MDLGLTFEHVLAQHAVARPDAIAVVAEGEGVTYGELAPRVEAVGMALRGLGLRRGDRVAVVAENRLELAMILLAGVGAGIVVAPVNWRLSAAGRAASVAMVNPSAVLVAGDHEVPVTGAPVVRIDDEPDTWLGLRAQAGPATSGEPSVRGEDLATIMSTSGSTGGPKGVAISHRALMARALLLNAELRIDGTDAFLGWAPMFHISSTDYLFTTCVLGGTYVVLPGFDPVAIADELVARRVGWLVMMPGLLPEVVDAVGDRAVAGLRCVGAMADLVPPEQVRTLTTRLSTRYVNSFGSTEAGLAPGAGLVELPADGTAPDLGKPPTRHCQYRVVDGDGDDVPPGGVGELYLRGPTLFSGYWTGTGLDSTAPFTDGWFRTGDLVCHRVNDRGPVLDFVERATFMIKTGGENVYPAVIERAFQAHRDVVSVAVISKRHQRLDTMVTAYVSLRAGATTRPADVVASATRDLAAFERPREVHLISEREFVRGVTGKIDRAALALLDHQCTAGCSRRAPQ